MSEIENLHKQAEAAKAKIARRDALARLMKNKDFKHIVIEGYLEKEAVRLAHISNEPCHDRNQVFSDIMAISTFKQFLSQIETEGFIADRDLTEANASIDYLSQNDEDE